jgi:hypothetical protein
MTSSRWVKGKAITGVWKRVAEKDMASLGSGDLIYSFHVTIVQRNI